MVGLIEYLKYQFGYLGVYFSPFVRPTIKIYCGPIKIGTPYFYPRKWIKNKNKQGYLTAFPKKIGFDFVPLGWKTKWSDTDYRFEYSPRISFVFFRWQVCVLFEAPCPEEYWTAWLFYKNNTDSTKKTIFRIREMRKKFPLIFRVISKEEEKIVDYSKFILKRKYL
jgi:hypothetical protein